MDQVYLAASLSEQVMVYEVWFSNYSISFTSIFIVFVSKVFMVSIFSLFLRLFTRLPFKVKQWNKICFLNCWCWCYVEQIAISYIYIDFDCSVEGRMYWNVFRFIYNFWIVSTYLVYGQVLELISGYEKWNCLASSHQIQKKTQFNVLMMHMGKKVLGGLINLTCQQTHQRHAIRYNGIEEGYSWIVPQQRDWKYRGNGLENKD